MDMLADLIRSGRIVDIVVLVLALELILLAALYARSKTGVRPYSALVNIGAGGSMAMALKASLTGLGWQWIAVWLVTSLVFHALDLQNRWQRAG